MDSKCAPEKPFSANTVQRNLADRLRRTYYTILNRATIWWFEWWPVLFFGAVLCLMATSFLVGAPALQQAIGEIDKDRLTAIETLLVTVGGSLIGASAIVSAMVVYALQVNVERMPHELFRRLSADARLLLPFVGTFLLATLTATLSMIVAQQDVVLPLFVAFWSSVLIVTLFGYAYRRTLDLVNPGFQLNYIVKNTKRDFVRWEKYADRVSRSTTPTKPNDAFIEETLDIPRLQLFLQFPQWTQGAKEALLYASSLGSHYAAKSDFGVVNASYSAILAIHALYLKAKGRTFVAANGFLDSPLVGDSFINSTLESLRQTHREAITQGNERYILANLQLMARLAELYLRIDYGSKYVTNKTHANLAAHYLAEAIKEVIPQNRPDVLMQGVRLLGNHSQYCLAFDSTDHISQLSERISEIALVGILRPEQLPVSVCAIDELGKLTIALLASTRNCDLRFPLHELRRDIQHFSLLVINSTKDNPLGNRHSHYLGGYYSATDPTAFPGVLSELANQLLKADKGNEGAQQCIRNIHEWCDQLYDSQKELLLAAVSAKSPFVFDMIYWVTHVTVILASLSKAAACPTHICNDLRKNANWLISVFSWLPDDEASVAHIAHYQLHERIFESAIRLHAFECFDVARTAASLLLSWAFRAGRYQNGWGTLEHALYCIAVLNMRPEIQAAVSLEQLKAVMTNHTVSQELLDRTARDIRSTAQAPFEARHLHGIEHAMSLEDPQMLSDKLMEIAALLSPATENEPVRSRHFF